MMSLTLNRILMKVYLKVDCISDIFNASGSLLLG